MRESTNANHKRKESDVETRNITDAKLKSLVVKAGEHVVAESLTEVAGYVIVEPRCSLLQ